MWLNADCPEFYCLLKKEFLYDQKKHSGEFIPCVVFGVASIPGRAIGFHTLTENGAQVARMPLSAFVWKRNPKYYPLHYLELWNCFAERLSVHSFLYLRGLRCRVLLRDQIEEGEYMFTIDWFGNNNSENPGEGGHKNAHVIKLDCGLYAAQPNNRIFWHEPAFVTKPFTKKPDYVTNNQIWSVENGSWVTAHNDKMFYDIKSMGDSIAKDRTSRPLKK